MAAAQAQVSGVPSEEESKGAVLWNMQNVQRNMATINWVRTFMTISGGACTGIMGFRGLWGLFSFLALYVAVSVAILVKAGFKLEDYAPGAKMPGFLIYGIMGQLMSFLLFWTLFYGIVHVY